ESIFAPRQRCAAGAALYFLVDGLRVVDRKKDMIKTGGENVASREVEEAIYRLSGVSEVAVIGVPHPRWIEAIVAVIVVKAGVSVSKEAVLMHCGQHLAAFKVPKEVIFAGALPKNPSGKLLKRELRRDHSSIFEQGSGQTSSLRHAG